MRLKLREAERVIVKSRAHPRALAGPVLAMLLVVGGTAYTLGRLNRSMLPDAVVEWRPLLQTVLLVVAAVLLGLWTLRPLLRWNAGWYFLTNRRLVQRAGLSRRSEREIPLVGIVALETNQSVVQRWSGSGDLLVDLGHGRTTELTDVPGIHRMRELTIEAIEALPRTAMFDDVKMLGEREDMDWTGYEQQ